jgi:pimeloyl-ACP methyl ester carboxylesterase
MAGAFTVLMPAILLAAQPATRLSPLGLDPARRNPLQPAGAPSRNAETVIVHGMLAGPESWQTFGRSLATLSQTKVAYYRYQHLSKLAQVDLAATGGKDLLATYEALAVKKTKLEQAARQPASVAGINAARELVAVKAAMAAAEAVINEEKALLDFLAARANVNELNVVAHSLGTSLLLNALAHAGEYGKCVPQLNVVVFLGSNMNQDNFLAGFPQAQRRCNRIYNVYAPCDRGCAWAAGDNLGKEGMLRLQALTPEAQDQIKNIKARLQSNNLIQGCHGDYRTLPDVVAALLTAPLMCQAP